MMVAGGGGGGGELCVLEGARTNRKRAQRGELAGQRNNKGQTHRRGWRAKLPARAK